MIEDQSFGIIPLKKDEMGGWQVLLLKQHNGHFWGFPKGHAESLEPPKIAAQRELKEETNLYVVEYLDDEPFEDHYHFVEDGQEIDKRVFYYPAQVAGDITLQTDEIEICLWSPLNEAIMLATYSGVKKICTLLKDRLES